MIKIYLSAETMVTVLLSAALSALIFLSFSKWQSEQRQTQYRHYLQQQALQIADNQIALRYAGMACETSVEQNNIQFRIQCNDKSVVVSTGAERVEIGQK
jgi:prepilin peptidase dependent protein C